MRTSPSRCLLLVGLLALASPAFAAIYTVTPDGTGDFPTIQAALDAASAGDIVELSDGIFRGVGNRDLNFAGQEITLRSQSDDPELCVIDCEGNLADPHRGFHFFMGEGPFTVIRGLTVTGGHSSDC